MLRQIALHLTLLSGLLLSACGGEKSSSANALSLSLTGRIWVSEAKDTAHGSCRLATAFGENQRFAMAYSCDRDTSAYYELVTGTFSASGSTLSLSFEDNQCSQMGTYFWSSQTRAGRPLEMPYQTGSGQLVIGTENASIPLSADQRRADSLPSQATSACISSSGSIAVRSDTSHTSVKSVLLAAIQPGSVPANPELPTEREEAEPLPPPQASGCYKLPASPSAPVTLTFSGQGYVSDYDHGVSASLKAASVSLPRVDYTRTNAAGDQLELYVEGNASVGSVKLSLATISALRQSGGEYLCGLYVNSYATDGKLVISSQFFGAYGAISKSYVAL